MSSLVLILAIVSVGQAELPNWARNSSWETAYESPAGLVYATVHIKDNTGIYRLPNGVVGKLSQIRFKGAMRHAIGDVSDAIVGNWSFPNGQQGYFVFRKPDQTWYTDGYWGYIRQGQWTSVAGSWDGCKVLNALPKEPVLPLDKSVKPLKIAPVAQFRIPENENNLVVLPSEPGPEVGFVGNGAPKARQLIKAGNHCRAVGQIRLNKDTKVFQRGLLGQLDTVEGIKGQRAGTCFLIAPNLAISARHVFDLIPDWSAVSIEFVTGLDQPMHVSALSNQPIVGDFDSCLLTLKAPVEQTHPTIDPSEAFIPNTTTLSPFQFSKAQIIHFPTTADGQEWNEFKGSFINRDDKARTISHDLPTHGGSSGAPLFDSQWRVVAVHYGSSGGNARLNRGYLIDSVIAAIDAKAKGVPEWNAYRKKFWR